MQITTTRRTPAARKPQAEASTTASASPSGLGDVIADGYHSLPRWPQAAVRGAVSYAPASIGAMIGTQYGGLAGRVVGAAAGSVASYFLMTEVADIYPKQAKMTAAFSGVAAAVQSGGGLSLSGVGISLAWGAGIGVAQEAFMGRG